MKSSVDVEAGDNHRFVPRLSMAVTEFYTVLRIEKKAMVDTLHREHSLSDLFQPMAHLQPPVIFSSIRTDCCSQKGGRTMCFSRSQRVITPRHSSLGWNACRSRKRPRVRVPSLPPTFRLHRLFWVANNSRTVSPPLLPVKPVIREPAIRDVFMPILAKHPK